MKKPLTELDREHLKLVEIDTCGAGEASALLARLRQLLGIITEAADIRTAVAKGGSLDPRALQHAGLKDVFDRLLEVQGQRSRFRFESPESLRTLLSLLEIQNGELRRINQHLRGLLDRHREEENEGVRDYRVLQLYAASTPEQRARVERHIEQDRLDYKARKARESADECKQNQARMRDNTATRHPVNWFAPMPVSNLGEPWGYVQANSLRDVEGTVNLVLDQNPTGLRLNP